MLFKNVLCDCVSVWQLVKWTKTKNRNVAGDIIYYIKPQEYNLLWPKSGRKCTWNMYIEDYVDESLQWIYYIVSIGIVEVSSNELIIK